MEITISIRESTRIGIENAWVEMHEGMYTFESFGAHNWLKICIAKN